MENDGKTLNVAFFPGRNQSLKRSNIFNTMKDCLIFFNKEFCLFDQTDISFCGNLNGISMRCKEQFLVIYICIKFFPWDISAYFLTNVHLIRPRHLIIHVIKCYHYRKSLQWPNLRQSSCVKMSCFSSS